jgi:ribosomal RNA-processing protein 17
MNILNGVGGAMEGSEEEEEGAEEQWVGFEEETPVNGKDAEYVDEDQYATVTVEAVEITRDGFVAHHNSDEESAHDEGGVTAGEEAVEAKASTSDVKGGKKPWSKTRPAGDKSKRKKKRNFKYESKEDRKLNRTRERSKQKAHAIARKARN